MWKFDDLQKFAIDEGIFRDDEMFLTRFPENFERRVRLAHDPKYVDAFYENSLDKELWRRIGFTQRPDHSQLVKRTKIEVAGTLNAAELALQHGMACHLGGGTHHAHRSYGAGYTALNDLGVTARYHAQEKKVIVIDVDVHQGDGTADICNDDPNIFTFSLHCADNYPFGFSPKAAPYLGHDRSHLDVGLAAGAGDAEVLTALNTHLPTILDSSHFDLCLYDAGIDAAHDDALGKLTCTDAGLFHRDVLVLDHCLRRRIPVASVIGGGYHSDRLKLARRHAIILQAATFVWRKFFHTTVLRSFRHLW